MAAAYGEMVRLGDRAVAATIREYAAIDHHDPIAGGRLAADAERLSRRADVLAAEMGFWECSLDVEPKRFPARTAQQRVIAQLDEVCAPPLEADEDIATDERVLAAQARSGSVSRVDAVRRTIADLYEIASRSGEAATRVNQLRFDPAAQETVHQLVAGLLRASAVFDHYASLLEAGKPLGRTALSDAVRAPARQVGLAALKLKATECVPL